MIKFPDRSTVTERILSIIKPDYTSEELKTASVTWWQNIRSSGGFGLTYAGSRAFEQAEIDYQEFNNGPSSFMGNMGLSTALDRKMPCPYYFYSDKGNQKIKIYDGRIAMIVSLTESVSAYLKTLEDRPNR